MEGRSELPLDSLLVFEHNTKIICNDQDPRKTVNLMQILSFENMALNETDMLKVIFDTMYKIILKMTIIAFSKIVVAQRVIFK